MCMSVSERALSLRLQAYVLRIEYIEIFKILAVTLKSSMGANNLIGRPGKLSFLKVGISRKHLS